MSVCFSIWQLRVFAREVVALGAAAILLNSMELDGSSLGMVLAHELSHVEHRDTFIMAIAATLGSIIMYIANAFRWLAIFPDGPWRCGDGPDRRAQPGGDGRGRRHEFRHPGQYRRHRDLLCATRPHGAHVDANRD